MPFARASLKSQPSILKLKKIKESNYFRFFLMHYLHTNYGKLASSAKNKTVFMRTEGDRLEFIHLFIYFYSIQIKQSTAHSMRK